jgi:hypothetical protein
VKERELRQHSTCSLCNRKIGESGLPLFWRLTVERFGIDMQRIRRQDGLAAFIGSASIAAVMGPDEDLARPLMEAAVLTVCEPCAMDRADHIVAAAMSKAEAPS